MSQNKVYNIILYDESGSKKLAATSAVDEDIPCQIRKYKSKEISGKYPTFELELFNSSFEDFYDKFDFMIEVINDLYKYKVSICALVKEINPNKSILILKGMFAKADMCSQSKTRYLGGTTKEAIQTLGFEQELHLRQNISAEHHQIKTTSVKKLEQICDCESDFPYWTIGITDIYLTKDTKEKEFIILDKVERITENILPDLKLINENYDEDFYGGVLNTASTMGNINNYLAIPNAVRNSYLRSTYQPFMVMTGTFNNFFPYTLGTKVKNIFKEYKNIDYWVITSLITIYDNNVASSVVEYSSWKEVVEEGNQ